MTHVTHVTQMNTPPAPPLGVCLVTGATGLLGSELVKQLIVDKQASRVVCLVRDGVPESRFFSEGLSQKGVTVSGDIRDIALLERTMNEYDVRTVFHLAAQTIVSHASQSPTETLDVNIRGTWSLLEAARRCSKTVKSVLFASSDKAYGDLKGTSYNEDFPLAGKFPYDVSKSCADLIAQSYFHSYGLNVCVTRCGNFFGPGDLNLSRIFPSTILAALNNRAPEIRSNGKYVRDYIFVADGASAYLNLARKMDGGSLAGQSFNFSYGLSLSVLDVVQQILKTMNREALTPVILNQASNEIPVQTLNSEKAIRLLDWKPRYGFEDGIRLTVEWYQSQFAKGVFSA